MKRIEVASVVEEDEANRPYLRVDGIKTEKRTVTARLAFHKLMKDGTVKETVVNVKPGDSLEEKSGRSQYTGFEIDEINPGAGFVRFSNDVELRMGESQGADRRQAGLKEAALIVARYELLKPLAQDPCYITAAVQNGDHL